MKSTHTENPEGDAGRLVKNEHTQSSVDRDRQHSTRKDVPSTKVLASSKRALRTMPTNRIPQRERIPQRHWQFSSDSHTRPEGREIRPTGYNRGSQVNPAPPWAPAFAPGWAFVLADFPCATTVGSVRFEFPLPPPHIFFGTSYDDKLGSKIHNWIRIRRWCLSQVSITLRSHLSCTSAQLLLSRSWALQETRRFA